MLIENFTHMNEQKILIIEDETSLRKNIAEILTFEGF